jgi:ABC-type phosphate transport system substrate-binding protein
MTLAVAVSLLLTAGAFAADSPPAFRVIVHPSNPTTKIDKKALADMFLKKTTAWRHGEAVRPVELEAESAVRRRFSSEVLNRSVSAVKSYWQQRIFSGRDLPPPELKTEQLVVKFVVSNPGAVGYVSTGANVENAKTLTISDD